MVCYRLAGTSQAPTAALFLFQLPLSHFKRFSYINMEICKTHRFIGSDVVVKNESQMIRVSSSRFPSICLHDVPILCSIAPPAGAQGAECMPLRLPIILFVIHHYFAQEFICLPNEPPDGMLGLT